MNENIGDIEDAKSKNSDEIKTDKNLKKVLSKYAIMSFVAGVASLALGFTFKLVLAPLAIYFGLLANSQKRKNRETINTFGLDLVGILLGGAVMLILVGVILRKF